MTNAALNLSHEAAVKAVVDQQMKRPYARIAMWANDRRREGKNDPHMNVKIRLNTIRLSEVLAEALAKGDTEVEIVGGAWTNEDVTDNRPAISGNTNITRYEIEANKAQAEAAKQSESADSREVTA